MQSKAHDLGSCGSAVALAVLCLMLAAGLPALGASVSDKEADPLSWAAVNDIVDTYKELGYDIHLEPVNLSGLSSDCGGTRKRRIATGSCFGFSDGRSSDQRNNNWSHLWPFWLANSGCLHDHDHRWKHVICLAF